MCADGPCDDAAGDDAADDDAPGAAPAHTDAPKRPARDADGEEPTPERPRDPAREGSYDLGRLRADLGLAWAEHRGHVLAATALFAVGLAAGLAMAAAGVDLLALLGLENLEDLLPADAELTVEFIFRNNSRVYAIVLGGALTLGLATVLALGVNGLVIGWVAGWIAGDVGVLPVLVLLVPHGIFELPAFWIAGGIAFRLVHCGVAALLDRRDRFLTRGEAWRTLLLAAVGWVLVGVAAVVEVHVTPAIAEAILGTTGAGAG